METDSQRHGGCAREFMGEGQEYGGEMADALPEAIILLDHEGGIVTGNAAWRRLAGQLSLASGEAGAHLAAAAPTGALEVPRHCSYVALCRAAPNLGLPPVKDAEALFRQVQERGESSSVEYSYRGAIYSLTLSPGGEAGRVVGVHRHLRERENGRARENEALYFAMLNKTRDGIFLCDLDERLIFANNSLCRWMGKECRTILGKAVTRLAIFEMDRILLDGNPDVISKGSTISFELSAFSAQGICTFSVLKMPYRVNGTIVGVIGVVQDMTGERAMERKMIAISDHEKQRLGQELHENLCQYLVGISLLANVLYEDLVKFGLKQGEDARQITGLVKTAISEVRALAKGLAPLPQEHGEELVDALHELVEQTRLIGKVNCVLEVFPEVNSVPSDTALHLFRIAQEAVHNAVKHAAASLIKISLLVEKDGAVILKIEDDGEGMHARSLAGREEMGSGLGLHMMKYRSRAIQGELAFHAGSPRGTTVICTVPGTPLEF